MKSVLISLFACPLMAVTPAQTRPAAPASQSVPGGYQSVDSEAATVQEAKAAAQKALAGLSIEAVLEAYQQVVAGMNYKLVCRVVETGAADTWEFVVWHRLDDTWKLTSARQLQGAD